MFSRFFTSMIPLHALVWGVNAASHSTICETSAFAALSLANIAIVNLSVTASHGVAVTAQPVAIFDPDGNVPTTVDICRIAIQYTHPGQYDSVNTYIALPLNASDWNSRFVMIGGGGWLAGDEAHTTLPPAFGYASSSTDGGHTPDQQTSDWAFASEGNTNWPALMDFSSVALVEAARLGKLAAQLYYGSVPTYSYWTGCSTGGRQGQMMAQRYPEEFDGIISGAPAISWHKWVPSGYWPVVVANTLDIQPPPCVLNALTDAAIAACDALDGIEDGVISLPGQCNFSAAAIVGQVVECTNPSGSVTITSDLARLADAIWTGRLADIGTSGWYGLHQDSPMTVLLNTTCTSIDNCTILPFPITTEWTQVFLARNSSYDVNSMTVDDYARFFRQSVDEYESIIGTESADLTNLRNAGTKVIVWHGMQDQIIATNGTIDYYERVLANDLNGNVTDYYRLFLAPGIEHCGIGNGFDPTPTMFNALRDWVENDAIPETLEGTGSILGGGSNSPTRSVGLCPYPSVLTYIGDDPNDAASFICV